MRRASCTSHLRQIQIGITSYEAIHKKLPPGTNGHPRAVSWREFRTNAESPIYWKRFQHASFLGYILPFIEREGDYEGIDGVFFDRRLRLDRSGVEWFAQIPGFAKTAQIEVGLYSCPSDFTTSEVPFAGGSQPVLDPNELTFAMSYLKFLSDDFDGKLVKTNYLGCAGAATGGIHPDSNRNRYKGAMSSGEEISFEYVSDGLSNTILVGETLGHVADGELVFYQPWIVGGLARGQGFVAWNRKPIEGEHLLGNGYNSHGFGFGSKHSLVNFAFADGSVRGLSHSADWQTVYRLCGMADGLSSHQ